MTEEQKELVQTSFEKVRPISDAAAVLFYDELFAIDPSLRGLFKSDMVEQRAKLMAMLGTAVSSLSRWESLVHQVSDWCSGVAIKMGRRQGATKEHIWIDT